MIRSFLLIVFIIVLGTDEAFALSPVVVQASASFVTTVWRRRVQQLQPVTSSRQQRRRVGVPTVTAQLAQPSRSSLQMSRASFLVLSASSSDDDELEFLGNTDGIGKARSTATTATITTTTTTTTTTASQQQQQAPNNDNNTKQQQQQQQHRRWIILVDDELAIRQAVGALLEQAGYEVTTCADAMSAWQLLVTATATTTTTNASTKSSSRHVSRIPAAVVSDVRMPGAMDGLDLVRRMRGIYNNNNNDSNEHLVAMPVVLLTAKARQTSDRIAGYQAGADVYLPKPFDPAELVVILDNLLQQYDQVNAVDHSSSSSSSSSSHSSNNVNNRLVRQAASDGLSDNNDNSGRAPGVSANSSNSGISLEDLQKDVAEIKQLLLQGGAGIGSGYVARHQSASDDNSNKDAHGTVVFLAPDERQVLELLCQGLPNAEIAQRTYLSKRRVEQLLTNMFRKTNVKNRTELVRWAVATGNVQL